MPSNRFPEAGSRPAGSIRRENVLRVGAEQLDQEAFLRLFGSGLRDLVEQVQIARHEVRFEPGAAVQRMPFVEEVGPELAGGRAQLTTDAGPQLVVSRQSSRKLRALLGL